MSDGFQPAETVFKRIKEELQTGSGVVVDGVSIDRIHTFDTTLGDRPQITLGGYVASDDAEALWDGAEGEIPLTAGSVSVRDVTLLTCSTTRCPYWPEAYDATLRIVMDGPLGAEGVADE